MRLTLLLLFISCFTVNAQEVCNPFFPIEEGLKWVTEVNSYSLKKTHTIKYSCLIKEIKDVDGKLRIKTESSTYGPKGKRALQKGTWLFYCIDGEFRRGVTSTITGAGMAAVLQQSRKKTEEYVLNGLSYPSELEVSQKLPGVLMKVRKADAMFNKEKNSTSIDTEERVVEEILEMETPFGKLEVYKIVGNISMSSFGAQQQYKMVEYLAKGYGIVRNEFYDSTGKLIWEEYLTEYGL